MDTKKLRFFITLSETGNMREAAHLLNISHAGLSKAIHTLEDEIGATLITKDGRSIRVTPMGRKLIRKMNKCLEAEQDLLSEVTGSSKNTKIGIGTFEVFSTYLSPSIARQLANINEVTFQELIPGDLEEEMILGDIDFGISYIPVPKPDLDHLEVSKIKMGVFAGNDFPIGGVPLDALPFVIPVSNVQGAPTKVKGLDGWPDDRIKRNIRYTVSLMETALALVRENLAVGYFPKFIAELHNRSIKPEFRLKELPIPDKVSVTQPVYAIKRKDCLEDAPFKAICRVLRGLK